MLKLSCGAGVRIANFLMVSMCVLASVACEAGYADEPASKESPAVQSATPPVSTATGKPAPAAAAPPTMASAIAASTTPATATPATATPVDRKKALQFGFRPGVVNGIPVFCKEVPIEGTRFTNKRCVREDQFSAYLAQLQIARDAAVKNGCFGADFCGNVDSMSGKSRMSMGTNR